jgi:hypothetical protein
MRFPQHRILLSEKELLSSCQHTQLTSLSVLKLQAQNASVISDLYLRKIMRDTYSKDFK